MTELNNKTEYKRNIAWFIELSIWFLLFIVIASCIFMSTSYYKNNTNTYQIFIQDVDGIIVGSPVRMMGIQVGYVRHVRIVNDMVYVDFAITQKGLTIPKGSKITIEFTGLGGSKSLEIYTPQNKNADTSNFLIIQQPRRIGAAITLLDAMFEKIASISYKCSSFANTVDESLKGLESEKTFKFDKSPNEVLDETETWIDNAQNKLDKIKKKNK